jgi:hypothetical protein
MPEPGYANVYEPHLLRIWRRRIDPLDTGYPFKPLVHYFDRSGIIIYQNELAVVLQTHLTHRSRPGEEIHHHILRIGGCQDNAVEDRKRLLSGITGLFLRVCRDDNIPYILFISIDS